MYEDGILEVEDYGSEDVTVYYEYLPDELSPTEDLDTTLNIDELYIDPRVLCKFASYKFLSEEGTDYDSARAQTWLAMFNDAFSKVQKRIKKRKQVRYNG